MTDEVEPGTRRANALTGGWSGLPLVQPSQPAADAYRRRQWVFIKRLINLNTRSLSAHSTSLYTSLGHSHDASSI